MKKKVSGAPQKAAPEELHGEYVLRPLTFRRRKMEPVRPSPVLPMTAAQVEKAVETTARRGLWLDDVQQPYPGEAVPLATKAVCSALDWLTGLTTIPDDDSLLVVTLKIDGLGVNRTLLNAVREIGLALQTLLDMDVLDYARIERIVEDDGSCWKALSDEDMVFRLVIVLERHVKYMLPDFDF